MLDLLGGDPAKVDRLEPTGRPPRVRRRAHQRRPGVPALARPRRRVGPRAGGRRPGQPGHHDPADGRPRAGHRGLPAGPGRVLGHAPQDEQPLLRAGQRPRRRAPRPPLDGAALAGDQWNEGDVSCSVVRRVALPDAFFATDGLFETFLTVLDDFGAYPAVIDRELRALPAVPGHHQGADGRGAGRRRPRGGPRGHQGARRRRGPRHAGAGHTRERPPRPPGRRRAPAPRPSGPQRAGGRPAHLRGHRGGPGGRLRGPGRRGGGPPPRGRRLPTGEPILCGDR